MARVEASQTFVSVDNSHKTWLERIPAAYWLVGILLLIMPLFASDFVLYQIFGWSFILGMISLSLMFLAGYKYDRVLVLLATGQRRP